MIANAALAACTLIAVAYTSLSLPLQFIAAVIALLHAGWQIRSHSRQRGLLLWQEGWQWVERNREPRTLELQNAVIWPGLIVLRFHDVAFDSRLVRWHQYLTHRNLTLTLCRDSLSADDARRLRAYLRHWPVLAD